MGRNTHYQLSQNDSTENISSHRKHKHHKKKDTIIKTSVTAKGHLFRTFHWTIAATAVPNTLDLLLGDTDTVVYTIDANKDNGSIAGFIEGQVSIANLGKSATNNLKITIDLTKPDGTLITHQSIDISENPIMKEGDLYCYQFHLDIPIHYVSPNAQYKVTVSATITNFTEHTGKPYGPSSSKEIILPTTEMLICNSINIDTSDDFSYTFYESGSQSYTKNISCHKEGKQLLVNTATVRETNQTACATVTIKGLTLSVIQTIPKTSFTRTYKWTITEEAVDMFDRYTPIDSLLLSVNQPFSIYCKIHVIPSYVDNNFTCSSLITITNPSPKPTYITIANYFLPDDWIVPIVSFPALLPANSQVSFPFSVNLPDQLERISRIAVIPHHDSKSAAHYFLSTANPVEFNTTTEIYNQDEYITVRNSSQGLLGTVHKNAHDFCYIRQIGPFYTCMEPTIESVSTFETHDTSTTDSTKLLIKVRSCTGYTHTTNYWQAHCGFGPQIDLVTPLLPITLGEIHGPKSIAIPVNGHQQVLALLQFKGSNGIRDLSNGINHIYAHLLSAKLNINSGADNTAVASAIFHVEEILADHDSSDWEELNLEEQERLLALVKTLAKFNNGLIGPGNFSEDKSFSSF